MLSGKTQLRASVLYSNMALLLSSLLLLFIPLINGHGSKFRSCSSTGFCKRQRASESSVYHIDEKSIKMANNAFEAVMLLSEAPTDDS